jgi:hypothetical protein
MERNPDSVPSTFVAAGAGSTPHEIPRAGQRDFEIKH